MSTAALEEVYAMAAYGQAPLMGLVLTHPGLATPMRLVTGTLDDLMLRPSPGATAVQFYACQMDIVDIGHDRVGPISASVRIDGVSGVIGPYIEAARQQVGRGDVTLLAWPMTGYATADPDITTGLTLYSIKRTLTSATAELVLEDRDSWAAVRRIFDEQWYKALIRTS